MPKNINYASVFLKQQSINPSKTKPPTLYQNCSIFDALCKERNWTALNMIWERLTAKSVNATIPKDLIVNNIDPLMYDTDGYQFFFHLVHTKVNYFYLIGHSPNFKLNVLRQMISEFRSLPPGNRKNKLDEVIDIIIQTYNFYAKNEENSCLFLDLLNDINSDILLIKLFESTIFRLNFIKNMHAEFDGKSIIDLTMEFASSSQQDADLGTNIQKFLLYTLLISPLEAINENPKPDTLTPDLAELYVRICCDPSNIPALFSPQQFFTSNVPISIIHEWFMRGEHITDFMASCFQLLFSHSEAQAFKENLDQYITSIFSTNSTIPPMFLSPEFSENSALRKMLMTLPNFAKYMQESPTSKDQTSVSTRYNMFPIKDAPAPPEKDLTPTPFNRFH